MADGPIRGTVTQNTPSISWDPAKCAFQLTLMGIELRKIDDPKQGYKFNLPMPVLYDIRIRKAGEEDWIFGVVLPFSGVEVSGLESGVEYEIQTTVLSPDKKPVQKPLIQRLKAEQR
ncbi:MAG: hypothetical protein OXP69_22305 [Spirochaetaceae bacterium]|nr:hypothetical protein [Spirochaetaceae bacterium]